MKADWKLIDKDTPRGRYEKRKTAKGEAEFHIADHLMVGRVGDPRTYISHYITEDDRWNGFTKKSPPTHWDYLPDGPK